MINFFILLLIIFLKKNFFSLYVPKLWTNDTKHFALSRAISLTFALLLFLFAGEKHHMLPTGELLIFSVTPADAHSTYRCRTVHHVTGDTVESSSYARLVVTGKSS